MRKSCITTSSLPPPFPLLFKIWLPISILLPILSKKSYPTPTSQSNLASFREVNSTFMKEGTILMQNKCNYQQISLQIHHSTVLPEKRPCKYHKVSTPSWAQFSVVCFHWNVLTQCFLKSSGGAIFQSMSWKSNAKICILP